MPMLLEVADVTKTFGGLNALHRVSFSVDEGDTVGIMGANGAGKTTLFSLIAGNARPTAGEILLRGERLDGRRPDLISRKGVARTFQIVRPFASMSTQENVEIAAMFGTGRKMTRSAATSRAREVLEEVGLLEDAPRAAGALTLPGQKRLEVARAVATGAHLLLLDEVMAGLTPSEVFECLEMIGTLKARYGLTLLVIEHVMQALMRLCDRIIVLHHGIKIAEGSPVEVAQNPAVIAAYLGGGDECKKIFSL